jgi:hypothetical protein
MLREMILSNIDRVEKGQDPKAVIRDPAQDSMIDTNLSESLVGPEVQPDFREMASLDSQR